MVPLWMFPIALACGNTFILKPSEQDPTGSGAFSRHVEEMPVYLMVFSILFTALPVQLVRVDGS